MYQVSTKPLVTIFTLVYNNAGKVIPALEAVKAQQYSPVEHIIIDDCSKDDSVAVIEGWIKEHDYSCTFIRHETNKGICASINEAITRGNGKYIFGISDDIMFPDKLVDDVAYLEAHHEAMFVHSKIIVVNAATGKEVEVKGYDSPNPFHDYLAWKMAMYTVTFTYRKSVFEDVGLFDETLFFEDFDMIHRITYKHKIGYRDKFSVKYIQHGTNMMSNKKIEIYNSVFEIMRKKWSFLPNFNYYVKRRELFVFNNLADTHKKEAIKYMFKSIRFCFTKEYLVSCYKLLFK